MLGDNGGDYGDPWRQANYLLECGGCGSASLRRESWEAGMGPDEDDVTVYPPSTSRKKPTWLWNLDPTFRTLMNEIYDSLVANGRALPVMGARTIMDMVIQEKVGDQGNFPKGLDALVSKGFLSRHDREILEAAIQAGHAAAHRGHTPEERDVGSVIDIVEHLLNSVFVLTDAAKNLKKSTPKRRRAKKNKAAAAKTGTGAPTS